MSVLERVQQIELSRHDLDAGRPELEAVLADITSVRSWLTAVEAETARRLAETMSFPESAIADSTRGSAADAAKTIERSETLDQAPDLASSLEAGKVTAGHIDAITKAGAGLEPAQRKELIEQCDQLTDVAEHASIEDWRRRVRDIKAKIERDDGMDRLARQKRATNLSTWVDQEGMWNLRGRFDPVTGVSLAAALDRQVEALFAEAVPDTCPTDPVAKQAHLRALALARLIAGTAVGTSSGRPEFVAVIDTSSTAGGGSSTCPACGTAVARAGWQIAWPVPVEIPLRVITELIDDDRADVAPVIVRNGIVLYAPGTLNLGRSTRLANRAQRRALRGLYATCAIPGCRVGYDRCKLHHIIWWRNGGRTDLQNLLPVCAVHHAKIHHDGWTVTLGPNRELTLTLPDGTIMTTGPPNRHAA